MGTNCDIIVIGAGIVGCSIALRLTQAGYRTLNLDSLPAPGYGSTSHSSAIVRPYYSHITSCAIAHEARFQWQRWPQFLGHHDTALASYAETGGLVLIMQGKEHEAEPSLIAMREVGVDFDVLSRKQVIELYPDMCTDSFGPPCQADDARFCQPNAIGADASNGVAGGIHIDACGYVSDPQLATHNLYAAAVRHGAKFHFNAKVTHIETSDGSISGVTVNGEQVTGPVVVNAAGPHSSTINSMAGFNDNFPIRTRAERHEVAYVSVPPGHAKRAGFFVDLDAGVYQRPDGNDLLIGSADPLCDPADVVDPDNYNDQFTQQWTTQVYRAATRFPKLQIESRARGIVGIYDVSPDWIPIYDKTDLPGYYVAIGTSGNQFKNAPIIGDIMHAIIEREYDGIDHDLDPAQLRLEHIQREVSLGFYSRLRKVQTTSNVLA